MPCDMEIEMEMQVKDDGLSCGEIMYRVVFYTFYFILGIETFAIHYILYLSTLDWKNEASKRKCKTKERKAKKKKQIQKRKRFKINLICAKCRKKWVRCTSYHILSLLIVF